MTSADDPLVQTLAEFLRSTPSVKRWLVGYSGGLDSTVLLHLLNGLRPSVPLLAVHVHHGLSDQADQWLQHCQHQCERWQVPFEAARVQVNPSGAGLEDAARQARYRVFEQLLEEGDGLLLAHHRDDQAETVVLRLLRGSGPTGLAAMASSRPLGPARLYRPLLERSRSELEAYARQHELSWIEDESNQSLAFDRNYLRHQLMPVLQERWPHATERFVTSARHCAQADQLMTEVAASDLQSASLRAERMGESIALEPLVEMSPFRRGNVLRHWLARRDQSLPEEVHLAQIEQQLIAADRRPDSEAAVTFGNALFRRYRQRLYLLEQSPVSQSAIAQKDTLWDGAGELRWGNWVLSLQAQSNGGFRLPAGGLIVSQRQPGERCRPAWRDRSQTLKKLLQESALEPWLRDQVPVLLSADHSDREVVAVGHLWPCAGWQNEEGQPGYQLSWNWCPK